MSNSGAALNVVPLRTVNVTCCALTAPSVVYAAPETDSGCRHHRRGQRGTSRSAGLEVTNTLENTFVKSLARQRARQVDDGAIVKHALG
jgi:hypothetical protein